MKSDSVPLTSDQIVVGDDSAIWLFGSEAQEKLRTYSKTISSTFFGDGADEAVQLIDEVLQKIDASERSMNRKTRFSIFRSDNKAEIGQELLKSISALTVKLQLRQAQLVKDLTILERMERLLDDCRNELSTDIEKGRLALQSASVQETPAEVVDSISVSNDLKNWMIRFEHRLQELELSRTVALQGLAQVKILQENDRALADQMRNTIVNVIPLWRSQIAFSIGVERAAKDSKQWSKTAQTVSRSVQQSNEQIRRRSEEIAKHESSAETDIQKIMQCNQELRAVLETITSLETENAAARDQLQHELEK